MLYFDTSYLVRLYTRTRVGRRCGPSPVPTRLPVASMAERKPWRRSIAS
jgi:hypothetical protein